MTIEAGKFVRNSFNSLIENSTSAHKISEIERRRRVVENALGWLRR